MPKSENNKNPAAVALGRLGGLKGGKARALNTGLIPFERIQHVISRELITNCDEFQEAPWPVLSSLRLY
jgi:hypothetical protein